VPDLHRIGIQERAGFRSSIVEKDRFSASSTVITLQNMDRRVGQRLFSLARLSRTVSRNSGVISVTPARSLSGLGPDFLSNDEPKHGFCP